MRELTDNEKGALVAAGAVAVGAAILLAKRTGKAEVKVGDSVGMDKLKVAYYTVESPLSAVYVNWGLKITGSSFNNGAGLFAGKYTSGGPFSVERITEQVTKEYEPLQFPQKPVLVLEASWAKVGTYETFVWLTLGSPSKSESSIIPGTLFVGQEIIIHGG